MSDELEILRGPVLDVKLAGDGEIEGYAARYDEVDGHDEVIARGAFTASIAATKAAGLRVPCLWQHHIAAPVGSFHDFEERPDGLYGRATLNLASPRGKEAWSFIRDKHLSGLSVGFCRAERRGRTIVSADLKEISIVSVPAADRARLRLRDCGTIPDLVDALAAGRLSRRDLELVARKSWPGLAGQDDPEELDALAQRIAARTRQLKGRL